MRRSTLPATAAKSWSSLNPAAFAAFQRAPTMVMPMRRAA
eukprot:CAMPEP_0115843820 /NCGR_PEP_ID=MMETSP0287-20121206/8511_1 /TAXON_ID=412157 /ORGANISM="Chrysochromulina rotalis, Strain UIO044" /LENGTH=39 /DNA_ID= /DNA_START= /DNA_END= /DNA_ORIENTATION=